jgi:hypothetical protein
LVDSGKGGNISARIAIQYHQISVHSFRDAPAVSRVAETLRRIRGKRRKDLLETHSSPRHPSEFL